MRGGALELEVRPFKSQRGGAEQTINVVPAKSESEKNHKRHQPFTGVPVPGTTPSIDGAGTEARPTLSDHLPASFDDQDQVINQVWREYKQTGSPVLRNYLIIHYMSGHVRQIAKRLHAQLPKQVDIEDLIDEAYEGLTEVIDRFDIERHIRFETFSSQRIAGAMRDYLRKINWKPRLEQTRSKLVQAEIERFHKIHGRGPDTEELRKLIAQAAVMKFCKKHRREPSIEERRSLTKLSEKTFRKIVAAGRPSAMVSFNSSPKPGEDRLAGDADAMSGFEDHRLPTPLTKAERADLRQWVTRGFTRRDRLILVLYYYEQLTMKEIGRTLGCSESRVSQRLDSILASLRSRLNRLGAECEFLNR